MSKQLSTGPTTFQAVLSDLRSSSGGATGDGGAAAAVTNLAALAEHVIQWAYDLIVLDPSKGPFRKKVTGSLLDGILGLLESLMVFETRSEVRLF